MGRCPRRTWTRSPSARAPRDAMAVAAARRISSLLPIGREWFLRTGSFTGAPAVEDLDPRRTTFRCWRSESDAARGAAAAGYRQQQQPRNRAIPFPRALACEAIRTSVQVPRPRTFVKPACGTRADGVPGQPLFGPFQDGRGEFFNQEMLDGRAILVRFVFTDITREGVGGRGRVASAREGK